MQTRFPQRPFFSVRFFSVLAACAAFIAFAPPAHAHHPSAPPPQQCYQSFMLGGLRYTYPAPCPQPARFNPPRPHHKSQNVTTYRTPNGTVTVIRHNDYQGKSSNYNNLAPRRPYHHRH